MLKPASFPSFLGTNFHSDIETFVFEDAIYHPGFGHNDNRFGLFTREGYLIPQAAFYTGTPSVTKAQPNWINPAPAASYPTLDTAIFCGHLHDQYGHVITEFLSRLTSLPQAGKKENLLVRCVHGIDKLFSGYPWVREIFSLLNVAREDLISPDVPVRIKRLIVSTPAFSEQSFCYDKMAEYCQGIGDKAVESLSTVPFQNEMLYLSRSLLRCGTIKIDNEVALENALITRGVKIVHPETLSFAEQVCLFRNNNIVAGGVGSAFHTSIFSSHPRGVAINFKNFVDQNYMLMDGASRASIDYVQSDMIKDAQEKDNNYYETKSIFDVENFSDNLVSLMLSKKEKFHIPNMGRFPLSSSCEIEFFRIFNHEGSMLTVDHRIDEVSTWDGPTHCSLLVAKIYGRSGKYRTFLVSEEGGILNLDFPPQKGPAYEIILEPVSNEEKLFAVGCVENPIWLTSASHAGGAWCRLQGKSIASWEIFKLEPWKNFKPSLDSRLHHICSLLACATSEIVRGNMEFYATMHPSLVSHVDYVVKSANCARITTHS